MVKLVISPCSSPNRGLAVMLVHSRKPQRTSLTEGGEMVDKKEKKNEQDTQSRWLTVHFRVELKASCSLTAYCTVSTGHWSPDHSFLSLCLQSWVSHSRICRLYLGREITAFHSVHHKTVTDISHFISLVISQKTQTKIAFCFVCFFAWVA